MRDTYINLRTYIVTMRVFYQEKYEKIKRKIEIKTNTARNISVEIKNQTKNENFYELIIILEVSKTDRYNSIFKVVNDILESVAIRDLLIIYLN